MTRLRASLILFALWAAIYLPGLGSTEIKGEEGRRILPAVTMLETGNWLVPYVGGEPFLRKPPLVNWAIAGAFKLTGVRNEWTARLPSALCVLALGLTIVGTSGAGWLKAETAFAAAIMAMTPAGLLAKARFAGAEIEGIYAPLTGIALVLWLAWWARGKSPWLVWTVPGVFLGLASLAKGPSLHLLFFYVVVLAVLVPAARRAAKPVAWGLRNFFHPAHFLGVAISTAIFAAWAVPYFKTPEARDAAQVWKRQGIERFTEASVTGGSYALNLPRGLADQLPWLLLVPLVVRKARRREEPETPGERAIGWPALLAATGAAAVLVLLVPGTLPRYVLPLGAVFALGFAWAAEEQVAAFGRWLMVNRVVAGILVLAAIAAPIVAGLPLGAGNGFDIQAAVIAGLAGTVVLAIGAFVLARKPLQLGLAGLAGASGALFGGAMLLYGAAAIRWINRGDDLRPLAARIDAALPPGAVVTIYDPNYQPWIFYLRSRSAYAATMDAIPANPPAVLSRGGDKVRRKFAADRPDLALAQRFAGKGGAELLLWLPR